MLEPAKPIQQPIISRHGVIAEAFEIMAAALGPFIDENMANHYADEPYWAVAAANRLGRPAEHGATDPLFQLLVLRRFWHPVFSEYFQADLRSLIVELIEIRNQWAHMRLPTDPKPLERGVLAVERLVAPVAPPVTGELRRLRARIISAPNPPGPHERNGKAADDEVNALLAQLSETESIFAELQQRYGTLEEELSLSRKIAAEKQLRLAALERQLVSLLGQSARTEALLADERGSHRRVEWLFAGLLATLFLVTVLAVT